MSRSVLWVLLAAALAGGCKRHEAVSAANDSGQGTSSPTAPPSPRGPGPMPVAGPETVVVDSSDTTNALGQLSRELRTYVIRTRSVPKDFDEFAAKAHLQAPPPPAGQKYAIQGQAVALVKR